MYINEKEKNEKTQSYIFFFLQALWSSTPSQVLLQNQ